jgi:hypothetical protein
MTKPPQPDREEILRAVRCIAEPGQVVELRALNVHSGAHSRPLTINGYFDNLELLADQAARIRGAQGVYITLNPPVQAVLARCANRLRVAGAGSATSDGDIAARRWLPVDADPVRPAEVSASDAEHDAAIDTARRVRAALAALGWPPPILADSGNGGHLLYRIDLAIDDPAQRGAGRAGLVERVLGALAARFDDGAVHIDARVFNSARIWKLYGTVARKGDHTDERPHRLARLLEIPEGLAPVPRELLEGLAGDGPWTADLASSVVLRARHPEDVAGSSAGYPGASPVPVTRSWSGLDAWLARHDVPVQGPHPWGKGGRRWVFPVCPWNPEHRGSAYIVELPGGAIAAGCHHNSCAGMGWRELRQIYDRLLRTADARAFGRQRPASGESSGPDAPTGPSRSQTEDIADLTSAILSWPAVQTHAGRAEAEARASILVGRCARLDRAGLLQVGSALRRAGLSAVFVRQWMAAVREMQRLARNAGSDLPAPPEYEVDGGRIYRLSWEVSPTGEPSPRREVVADFALRIVEEAAAEDGRVWFTLEGMAADGRVLRLELPAAEFADDRCLQVALTAAAGPRSPVRAHMLRHLRPAIQLLTGEVPRLRRFDRTGWVSLPSSAFTGEEAGAGGGAGSVPDQPSAARAASPRRPVFLLPGREPPGVIIRLPRKLPYRVEPDGDLTRALAALEAGLTAGDPRRTTVLLAALLGAPLARPGGLDGERYGVFICGRTGSLKTSTAQVLMCIYGAGFIEDQNLLKMGEGATRNALMGYASHVHDLPLLIDNYKPSTGDGVRGLVNLLHNLLEGGDRERMTRSADLRETRPVHCWPIFTGEDLPDADAAGLARLLILPFEALLPLRHAGALDPAEEDAAAGTERVSRAGEGIGGPRPEDERSRLAALSLAQAMAGHLPAVGETWLAWLEGEGAEVAAEAGARFPLVRTRWLEHLRQAHGDMANPLRVASSLACNELTWSALRRHPHLGALAERFGDHHAAGVMQAAMEAAGRSAVSLEAARFLAVLRELLATGRCEIVPRGAGGRRTMGDGPSTPKEAGSSIGDASAAGQGGSPASSSRLRRASTPEGRESGRPGGVIPPPQAEGAGAAIPERTLGWECPDGSIYLLPELARREVERVLGSGGLNGISSRTLHEQLSELGLLASHDPGRYTRKIWKARRTHNVLHLRPDALEG